jgi:hypothetical protein
MAAAGRAGAGTFTAELASGRRRIAMAENGAWYRGVVTRTGVARPACGGAFLCTGGAVRGWHIGQEDRRDAEVAVRLHLNQNNA